MTSACANTPITAAEAATLSQLSIDHSRLHAIECCQCQCSSGHSYSNFSGSNSNSANGNNNNDDDERPKCLRSLCMCINVALLQRFHISTFRPHLTCWSPTKQLTVCPLCTSFHSLRMFFSFLFYLSFTAHASCPLCAVEMNLWLWLLVSICMPRTLCQYDYQTTTTTAYHPQIYICKISVVVVVVATAATVSAVTHLSALYVCCCCNC